MSGSDGSPDKKDGTTGKDDAPGKKGAPRSGKKGVADAINGAKPASAGDKPPKAGKGSGAPAYLAARFEMSDKGLFRKGDDTEKAGLWVSSPFTIEAEIRDADGVGWGLLMSWRDRDGVLHKEPFSRATFVGECAEVRGRLADAGLSLNASQIGRQAFAEFLNVCASPKRARTVSRVGWHTFGGVPVFVLPDTTYGAIDEAVVLQTAEREASPFQAGGALKEWQSHVCEKCVGNSRLMFAVSAAFAAALLGIVDEEGGGINFRGSSRTGKSTALKVSASVWGGAPGRGAAGYVRQWRATANGLEGVASSHSDTLLPLDEMGQVDAKEIGELSYMLSNGVGKSRAGRGGLARPAQRWRVLFLSSGEVGLADKNIEAGRATKAGQEVRLADLPADAGAGMGLFEELHGLATPSAFAHDLANATTRYYGTAAPPFLTYLSEQWRKVSDWPAVLRARVEELLRVWLASYGDVGGQVRSVGRRFALIGVAGEMAREAGVTEWFPNEAALAAGKCFHAWLLERGTLGAREDDQAVEQISSFISLHGQSRFEPWQDIPPAEGAQGETDRHPPQERFRTQNRAGWRRWMREEDGVSGWRYYFMPAGWAEALAGLNRREASRVLIQHGYLLPGSDGKTSRLATPPGSKKVRVYEVRASILAASQGDA